MAPVQPGIEPG